MNFPLLHILLALGIIICGAAIANNSASALPRLPDVVGCR